MIVRDCAYEPPHTHTYPDDWVFSGPSGTDPRADQRWVSSTYIYLDRTFRQIWLTQTPLCDDQAIDEFTKWGKDGAVYLQAKRPDGRLDLLPVEYFIETDTVSDVGG